MESKIAAIIVCLVLVASGQGEQNASKQSNVAPELDAKSKVKASQDCTCLDCQCRTVEPVVAEKPKPVLTMYSATWCGPCQAAKAAMRGEGRFDLVIVDTDREQSPGWVNVIPAFEWTDSGGQKRSLTGWSNDTLGQIKRSMGVE